MSQPPALLAAVGDRRARARRTRWTRRVARWWRQRPDVADLHRRLEAIGAGDRADAADAVLEAARPLIERIDWIEHGIAAMARLLRREPLFEPPFRPVQHETQQGLALIDHPLLRMTVQLLPADAIARRKTADLGRRAIGFTGQHSLLRFHRAAGVELDLWDAEPARDDFSAVSPGRCRPAGRLAISDGTILRVDGSRRAWTFARVPEDILLVHAVARTGGAPFTTEFDATDGTFLVANEADVAGSRMQLMAAALGRMGRRDALPVLAAVARDAPFALRWQIAREMTALDPVAALPTIRRMAEADPHREVRLAARATLALLAA